MLNSRWWRSLSIGGTIITAVVLFGIGVGVNDNLFQTGITPGVILGIFQAVLAWGIWKNRI